MMQAPTTHSLTVRTPIGDHPATDDVELHHMDLSNGCDGWAKFPHPDDIVRHVDDELLPTDGSGNPKRTFTRGVPSEVRDVVDQLTDSPSVGDFLVFDAADAYAYLESLQRTTDLHLENFHRSQLIVDELADLGTVDLERYDKRWICNWEVRRRMAELGLESWGRTINLTKQNTGLPNAPDTSR